MGETQQEPELTPKKLVPQEEPKNPLDLLHRLHAIQKECEDMKKEGWNDHAHYQYLTASQVVSKIKELMDKHGVLFTYSAELLKFEDVGKTQKGVVVKIDYKFWNIDDEKDFLCGRFDSLAGDSGDKQVFKAVTGGIKYIYTGTFNIANEDDPEKDGEGKKKVVQIVQNADAVVGQIKQLLNKIKPGMTSELEALTLFREKTGLTWRTFKNVTLAQAKAGQMALLSNMAKK